MEWAELLLLMNINSVRGCMIVSVIVLVVGTERELNGEGGAGPAQREVRPWEEGTCQRTQPTKVHQWICAFCCTCVSESLSFGLRFAEKRRVSTNRAQKGSSELESCLPESDRDRSIDKKEEKENGKRLCVGAGRLDRRAADRSRKESEAVDNNGGEGEIHSSDGGVSRRPRIDGPNAH